MACYRRAVSVGLLLCCLAACDSPDSPSAGPASSAGPTSGAPASEGTTCGRAVAAADELCTSNVPVTYRWTETFQTSGGSGRREINATIHVLFKIADGYGTDAGSVFTLTGLKEVTKLYATPCAGKVMNEALSGGGRFLDFDGSKPGSPFVSLLAVPGSTMLDATVVGDLSGTYVESGDSGACETKEIAVTGAPYTLDCPFHDNSTAGYVEGKSTIIDHHGAKVTLVDLGCSDAENFETGDGTGRRTVEVSGHIAVR